MPIRRYMKSFWWFLEGRIGGMGRPGFNQCHYFDLSFEEGILWSWLGKQSHTTIPLAQLWSYLDGYGPKVALFYHLSPTEARHRLACLRDHSVLLGTLEQMNAKAGILYAASWAGHGAEATLQVTPSAQRLQYEIDLLKQCQVSVVIALVEQSFEHVALASSFDVHHIPVEDVTPPSHEQVYAVADILCTALATGKNVVAHCLAGIGRTTTMLIAAHLIQGYRLQDLATWVQVRNPHFHFTGPQVAFLRDMAADVASGRLPLLSAERQ